MNPLATWPHKGDARAEARDVAVRYGTLNKFWLVQFNNIAELHTEAPTAADRPYAQITRFDNGEWIELRSFAVRA